jgi:methyl-accepting chemotaxis protein
MADVSVEFGAKDTGLENTLRTVQDELTRLNEEVKSGELSFDELQRAMRDISKAEKVQDQLMGMADAAQDAGDSASDAAPEIDDAGDSMNEMGDSATGAGEKSEMGFGQMALAVAAGQAAVELAMGAIKAAIDAVTGTFDKFGQAIDRGAELDILSTRTGVASDELARLGRALDNTGASGDMLGPVFDRMNRAIAEASDGSGAAGEALAKLGINIQDLKTLSPEQQFEKIGTALSSVADRSERADMAIDIFGRGSGTRLLRLFEDYPGAIGQANRQLGIFPSIMAEMSASFEAVSTEMNAAREKVVEFATGILSRMMPAIEAIATGLASIDAAALGQKLADAFLGGQKAMGGFQAAIDAFQVGNIMDALNILWESTKLQSLQTANEVGRNLIAGFKSAGDFLGEIFDLNGALVRYMKGTFIFIGGKLQEALGGAVLGFIESLPEVLRKLNPVIGLVESSIRKGVTKAAEEANDQFALMYHSVDELKHQFVGAGSRISENMNKNLETTGDLIGGLDERAEALKKRQDEITAAVAKTNEETKKTNEHLAETPQHTDKIKGDFDQMMRDMQIAGSATGGLSSGLSGAVQPANNLAGAVGGVSGEAKTLKEHIDQINQEKMEVDTRPFRERLNEVRGDLDYLLKDLLGTSVQNVDLSSLISKFGLLSNGLDGPEIKLEQLNRLVKALQEADPAQVQIIVDEMGSAEKKMRMLGDLAREQFEGIDATPRIDREAVGEGVNWTKDTIETALAEFKPKISPEVNEPQLNSVVEEIRQEIESSLGEPVTLDLEGSDGAQQAKSEVDSEFADPISLGLNPDVDFAREVVESGFSDPVPMELDAQRSIGEIREQLKEEIDLSLSSSKGTEHLTSIDKVVEAIKGLVEKIEGKLPMQALA